MTIAKTFAADNTGSESTPHKRDSLHVTELRYQPHSCIATKNDVGARIDVHTWEQKHPSVKSDYVPEMRRVVSTVDINRNALEELHEFIGELLTNTPKVTEHLVNTKGIEDAARASFAASVTTLVECARHVIEDWDEQKSSGQMQTVIDAMRLALNVLPLTAVKS